MKRFFVFLAFLFAFESFAAFSQERETPPSESGVLSGESETLAEENNILSEERSAFAEERNILVEDSDSFAEESNGLSEDDAFGFDDEEERPWSLASSLKARGEVSGRLLFWNRILSGDEDFEIKEAGAIYGRLNVSFASPWIDAFLNLRFDTDRLLEIDEAYARYAFQAFEAELGLRKLTWGRADSMGPLDVINPLDSSELTNITDLQKMKIPRPMLHLSYRFNGFTKLEGVFIPWFQAHKFDLTGRWTPSQVNALAPVLALQGKRVDDVYFSEKENLEYAQAGLRFTTTWGPADLGFQYYTGMFNRPAAGIGLAMLPSPPSPPLTVVPRITAFDYNRFHQLGADAALVLAGFNLRGEAGVNLTADLSGDDPEVENPALVYSLGFDRDLPLGINVNLQLNGKIRLMQNKLVIPQPLGKVDVEARAKSGGGFEKTPATSHRFTGLVSKKFLSDELELKATALWGIEDQDVLIIPALVWTWNDFSAEFSAGFFGGSRNGELGQYRDNSYLKTALTWKF
jgi:hypothetical protein